MSGSDLFTGTLELLILRTVQTEAMHGFGVGRVLRENSSGVLDVAEGVLYPALHRMEERGLLAATWGRSESGRRAKFYALTAQGRRRLEDAEAEWRRFTGAVETVLRPAEGGAS